MTLEAWNAQALASLALAALATNADVSARDQRLRG